jgi:hypothetical protein
MDNIIEPNETFDFSKLSLAHPSGIQGGAYFTKIEYNKKPLYIQTTQSQTRQGFVKTGKKYYCDLMFNKDAESLIQWFENLEERCRKLIFERRDTWFEQSLEENDIESAFSSTIRIYKSGKFYLIRTNVKNNVNNLPSVTIYDERQRPLSMDDIKNDTNVISILEIQGIKFTSRNFQIEIELKQVMVLDNEPIFDSCMIKNNKQICENVNLEEQIQNTDNDNNLEEQMQNTDNDNNLEEQMQNTDNDNNNDHLIDLDLDFEDLNEENVTDLKEVTNFEVPLENNLNAMQLKKPNQVYFELYKEARNKAKIAKKNALLAYLEAKNIKKTYMLDNLNDSDSDFDAEIDDVSESELDGL